MNIDKETVRVSGLTGLALGVGSFAVASLVGGSAYHHIDRCTTQACDKQVVEAYQQSGDAATLPFWGGLGVIIVSGLALKATEKL